MTTAQSGMIDHAGRLSIAPPTNKLKFQPSQLSIDN
jgi:hypothetical protein